MEIMQTRVLYGPNRWTMEHKAIEMDIALAHPENPDADPFGTYTIKNAENVAFFAKYFPHESANTYRAQDLLKSILLEVHERVDVPCQFVTTQMDPDHYFCYLVYSFRNERLSIRIGRAAVRIALNLLKDGSYDWSDEIDDIRDYKANMRSAATTDYLIDEVERRKIPYRKFTGSSLATLGYGIRQRKIRTAITDSTSGLGMELASDKEETKDLLRSAHLPSPNGILVGSEEELRERINEVRFPFVIKPLDGNQGRGVTTNITKLEDAVGALHRAQKISQLVIVEEYVKGDDYRFLVINYELIAATKRVPAHVVGDGTSTIGRLIEEENKNPMRGDSAGGFVLAYIKVDKTTERILLQRGMTLDTVLPAGEVLHLKDTANISAGGTAEDVTDIVHPENKFLAEHVARLFDLDICGIDIVTDRVDVPITRETGAIIEVNAGPGIRMHSNPQIGKPRNVAAPIINMLFRETHAALIPIIAYAGSVPEEILIWISQMAMDSGFTPGYTGQEGIAIKNIYIYPKDATDFHSAQDLLFDPVIDLAVLSCEYYSIDDHGLPFEHCDMAVLINREEKKPNEIAGATDSLRVLAKSVFPNGHVILDADDDFIFGLKQEITCEVALVSADPNNARIREHISGGGLAALLEDGCVNVYKGNVRAACLKVEDAATELTKETGKRMKDVLSAVLIAHIYKLQMVPHLAH
jgi:cyanophycin synthetase